MKENSICQKRFYSPAKICVIIIAFALMFLFRYLPAPAPITATGMALVGLLLGYIVLLTFVDVVWPTFLVVVLLSFNVLSCFPNSTNSAMNEAIVQSFGHWIPVLVLGCLLITYTLEKVGLFRRVTFWFMTRKFARKGPFAFTVMFLTSILIIACVMDATPVLFFGFGIAYELFEMFGYKKGDEWPKFIICMINVCVLLGFFMTPICHSLIIMWLGMHDGMVGASTDILSYMIVGIPVGIVMFVLILLWYGLIKKPDMTLIRNFDFSKLEKSRPGPMGRSELFTTVVFVILLFCWIFPGILALAAPGAGITVALGSISSIAPCFLAIVVLCVVAVDGKPVLDILEALKSIPWACVILLIGIQGIASAITSDATGITALIISTVSPLLESLGPYWVVTLTGLACFILSNFFDDVPVGILFATAIIPVANNLGYATTPLIIAICIGSLCAFLLPAGCLQTAIVYTNDWTTKAYTFKHGIVMCVVNFLGLLLVYPLAQLVYG